MSSRNPERMRETACDTAAPRAERIWLDTCAVTRLSSTQITRERWLCRGHTLSGVDHRGDVLAPPPLGPRSDIAVCLLGLNHKLRACCKTLPAFASEMRGVPQRTRGVPWRESRLPDQAQSLLLSRGDQ